MNKYKVKVSHVFSEVIDIEAENEQEAKEKVKDELQKEDRQAFPAYEASLPMEHWSVITEEKYNELVAKLQAEQDKQAVQEEKENNS